MEVIAVPVEEEVKIEEKEFTEEETKQHMLQNENDLLAGLLAAADYAANEEMTFDISRGGRHYFSFTVHPLSEDTMYKIRRKYTKYTKNKRAGIKVAEELDVAKFRCSVIYNSTIDSDKAKIWDNKALWSGLRDKGFNIITALDVIEALLLPGEKDRIMEQLDKLGGYDDDEDDSDLENKRIETAKN